MKRLLSALLVLTMVLCLASCGKKFIDVPVKYPEGKVVILMPTKEHYPEDYVVVKKLAEENKDIVVVMEYEDTRRLETGDPDILVAARKAAEVEGVQAVIFARAGYFTYNAAKAIKSKNPNIVIAAIEPEDDISKLNEVVDLTVAADRQLYAEDIISAAKSQKAEYFVFFAEDRYVKNNFLYMNYGTYFKSACEEKGIKYIEKTVKDSLYEDISVADSSLKETIKELYDSGEIKGENVVFYSLNPDRQTNIINAVNEKGLIYIAPAFPTAYSGVAEAYSIDTPENVKDVDGFIKSVKAIFTLDNADKGRLSMYTYSLASRIQRGTLYAVYDIIVGNSEYTTNQEIAIVRLNNTDPDKRFIAQNLPGEEKSVICYAPGFEKIK